MGTLTGCEIDVEKKKTTNKQAHTNRFKRKRWGIEMAMLGNE
jgi:hypothetical protein